MFNNELSLTDKLEAIHVVLSKNYANACNG